MMRVLFVVPYTPNRIRTRPYNLVRHLRRRGHQVTLLALYTSPDEEAALSELMDEGVEVVGKRLTRRRSAVNSLRTVPTKRPIQSAYCWHPGLASKLTSLLQTDNGDRPFDVVHVEHLRGVPYALLAQKVINDLGKKGGTRMPVIWDSVDCISHLFGQASTQSTSATGRWMTRLELARTQRYEGWLTEQFDAVLTTSTVDQEALLKLAPANSARKPPVLVLPNGVDHGYYRPDPALERDPATLVLSGKMSYHANVTMVVHFVREIMPTVWKRRPDTRVVIVGKDPTAEVRALSSFAGVEVTGTVSDIRPYLQQATVAIAPITYGAGVQNKVLEAMACGTPVVASPQAVAALNTVDGRDVMTGENKEGLAASILTLLSDPERRAVIGEAGRAYIIANHEWFEIAGQLEKIYQMAAAQIKGSDNAWRNLEVSS